MPFVAVESEPIRADRRKVYALACDMESFPSYMPDVKSVKVLERGPNWTVTEWVALLKGRTFRWKERDEFDPETPCIRYRLEEGDLKKFEGEWTFEAQGEETRVRLTVDFELGVPMIAALLNPVAKLAVRDNCAGMLAAIKARAEAGD
ncbi:MAG: aromatase/cyclase [Acetobacteraceae bacterium]|nr:aromatase/cyclase [Acetobacteraceae bacterium]